MARRLIGGRQIPRLSLDEIAWDPGPQRKRLHESLQLLNDFLKTNDQWVIEGCYSDLVEAALGQCTELRFLNPGIEVCVAHCHRRLWEPERFSSAQQQGAMLEQLVLWVKQYEIRDDEYGLKRQRKIFEQFAGSKREFTSLISYDEG